MANYKSIKEILEELLKNKISIEEAEKRLKLTGIQEIENFAKLDINREVRSGIPEIILAEGKTPSQLAKIVNSLKKPIIITRASEKCLKELKGVKGVKWHKEARVITINVNVKGKKEGVVGIITAGTSDIPVAEEAGIVAEAMGCKVMKFYDVGVAGLHRLLVPLKKMIGKVNVIVVAAGRDGVLPSVVAGIVDVPVIGLPTSVGYGFGGNGESALKTMLQSCSFLTVVNIDNGVGAGACAALIAKRAKQ